MDGVPSGKPVTRNYEVAYGISNITFDSPNYLPGICPTSTSSGETSAKEAYVDVSGTATKGLYVSVLEPANNRIHCESTRASKIDGKWSCRVHGVKQGSIKLTATQSFTPNEEAIGPMASKDFYVKNKRPNAPQITYPQDGYNENTFKFKTGFISISGLADPDSQVIVTIFNDENQWESQRTVGADKNGRWETGYLGFKVGGYKVQASSWNCDIEAQSDKVSFSFTRTFYDDPPCPHHAICHD